MLVIIGSLFTAGVEKNAMDCAIIAKELLLHRLSVVVSLKVRMGSVSEPKDEHSVD